MVGFRVVPARLLACLALVTVSIPLAAGCGDDTARIAAERREAAESARQSERIKQLERELRRKDKPRTVEPEIVVESSPESSSPSGLRVPESGSYRGVARQRGARSSTNKDYDVTMVFSSGGSFVEYPSLGCEGRMIPDGFDGDRRVYREQITSGHCDRNGMWKVKVESSRSLSAEWTLPSQDYVVVAELTRG